jgi:hypothetical protein
MTNAEDEHDEPVVFNFADKLAFARAVPPELSKARPLPSRPALI